MSALVDVCVLVAAHRADHPHHPQSLAAVDSDLARGLLWCAHVRNGFLRLVTHPAVFAKPTPIDVALAAWQAWADRPESRNLIDNTGADRHFAHLCRDRRATGNAIYDLHLAALALADGSPLWSLDRNFAAIPDLRFRRIPHGEGEADGRIRKPAAQENRP